MPVHEEISIISSIFNLSIIVTKVVIFYLSILLGFKPTTKSVEAKDEISSKSKLINAKDISEIVSVSGYRIKEYVVTTNDGYLLVLHKLESKTPTNQAPPKGIVYFHHGLLTCSELWVLGSEHNKTLPYLLLDLGYEIWLGNNRGNKYSRKHLKLSASNPKFWDFSLDEFSYFDIPNSLNYIQNYYNDLQDNKIIYIGFSQGCSQLFASLSLHPQLNNQIKLFVGLSPAIIPQNLSHPIFKMIVSQTANDNSFLYSLFGRRAILSSVAFWSTILGPEIYEKIVDKSLILLFGWNGENISNPQKEIGYPHLFSNSSVKSLLHWFQIIKANRFQMFDETCSTGLTKLMNLSKKSKIIGNKTIPFPITDHLNVPMYLFYGDNDILVDIERIKSLIVDSNHAMINKLEVNLCQGYEHMDTLWGNNVYEDVFKRIIDKLDRLDGDKTLVNGKLENLLTNGNVDKQGSKLMHRFHSR
ncbi:unnamed protein product [Candida verbasci]|uniref:Partial AB-hydrolase lipase domain-containing protein n=1 Tax=Candida verbasci TaxID=1227364 RepID=A0A9W4XCH9_9ASCO|nr:unnamed protein product [Candida verbasci]